MSRLLEGLEVYLVGGAVRDQLLGRDVNDRDWVVVGTTPDQMKSRGFKSVGHEFPVFLHPDTREEYALARTERKTGPGYRGFEFQTSPDITLEQDLNRRDLTINAMAQAPDGTIIDPFGGRTDLANRVLKHVSGAFAEDPVRVLRVARFRARFGFDIAHETLHLMQAIVASGETDHLVPERVWQELNSALAEKRPSVFFETLKSCGALSRIAPEIDRLSGVPQNPKYHPEIDTWVHTMMVVDQAAQISDDNTVRFAALVHDLGKGTTPQDQWPHHHGHEQTGLPQIEQLCRRVRAPNDYRRLALAACDTHLQFHRAAELTPAAVLELFESIDAFRRPERLQQILTVCEADYRGRTGYENRTYSQNKLVNQYFLAAQEVDAGSIAKQHEDGRRIADEIRHARCAAIKSIKQDTG